MELMQRSLRHLPNLLSTLRILLVVPIAVTLTHHQWVSTLWLFFVAAVSDGVDGFLARRFSWQSELGGILDPLADKLMMATVFVMFALLGCVPPWLTVMVLTRDGIIVLGAVAYRVLLGPVAANPSFISKLNTLCQIVFIMAVIGTQRFSWPPAWLDLALGALVFVTVVLSGLDYVLVYGARAAAAARLRRSLPHGGRSNPA
jgi:cardiolipin synthase